MIIAFSGNDGSGKTTLINKIIPLLRELGLKVTYRHEYDYLILNNFLNLFGKAHLNKKRKEMLVQRKKKIIFFLWPFFVWFDLFVSYLYYKLFKRKEIVILDRYPYDHYLSFVRLGYITKLSKFLFLHFPKADVNIFLFVEPQIAYERKKETHSYSLEFYETQTRRYYELSKKLGVPLINTNLSIETTLAKIFDVFFHKKSIRRIIIRKGMQNKTFFNVFLNIPKSKFYVAYQNKFKERNLKREQSLSLFKKLLKETDINDYTIFKYYNPYKWVGNDVDIILKRKDFMSLCLYLDKAKKKGNLYYNLKNDHSKSSLEIIFNNVLPLDVHNEIEWGGLSLFNADFLIKNSIKKEGSFWVKEELNVIIFSLATILDKGFLVALEWLIIKNNLKFALKNLKIKDKEVKKVLTKYLSWIEHNKQEEFPVFLPLYFKLFLLNSLTKKKNIYKRISLLIKILGIQSFWKIRYNLFGVLPYEIKEFK